MEEWFRNVWRRGVLEFLYCNIYSIGIATCTLIAVMLLRVVSYHGTGSEVCRLNVMQCQGHGTPAIWKDRKWKWSLLRRSSFFVMDFLIILSLDYFTHDTSLYISSLGISQSNEWFFSIAAAHMQIRNLADPSRVSSQPKCCSSFSVLSIYPEEPIAINNSGENAKRATVFLQRLSNAWLDGKRKPTAGIPGHLSEYLKQLRRPKEILYFIH